jgi:type I restriction enzyme S subunit
VTTLWPTVPLAEIVENREISYGVVQPGREDNAGVPIVRVKDVRQGRIDIGAPLRIAPSVSMRHSRTILRGGELLISVVGTIGETAVVPPSLAGWNVARAIAVIRPRGVSAKWIRLALETPEARAEMGGVLNTTVQATLNLSDLKKLPIPMPSSAVRQAIVDVAGALDDKIAANDHQLKLADQLAEAIFTRSASGPPVSEVTFAEIAEVGGGGTPRTSTDEYWGGGIPWATPTDVTALAAPYLDATARTITDAGLTACASGLNPAGSILMTSRATIGAFAIAQVPVAVNQGFIVVNAKDPALQWWLFHDMRSRVQEFLTFANGATFLELPRGRFKSLPVRLPGNEAARKFNEQVSPLHALAVTLVRENRRLAVTRDELLPLLMSGKVRVRDAERRVEDAL